MGFILHTKWATDLCLLNPAFNSQMKMMKLSCAVGQVRRVCDLPPWAMWGPPGGRDLSPNTVLFLNFSRLFIFRNSGNKDTNYMLAILDSRMKIVAHERFQYVLLKKFGEYRNVNIFQLFLYPAYHLISIFLGLGNPDSWCFTIQL